MAGSVSVADLFASGHPVVDWMLARSENPVDLVRLIPEVSEHLIRSRRIVLAHVSAEAHLEPGPMYVAAGAVVEPGAFIAEGCYIGEGAVVRHGAYVRSGSVLLEGALMGHASECKNSVLLPGAKAPHFAYVGDSVLGASVNLGAGTKLSNVKLSSRPVRYLDGDVIVDTGMRKFGAVLGDGVQTGCNSVLNPGVILGAEAHVLAGSVVSPGAYPRRSVLGALS